MQQILIYIKEEIDGNTITGRDFNTPLKTIDRSFRKKISKATEILNDITEQLALTDIFRILHPPPKTQNMYSFQVHMEHSLGLLHTGTQN